MNENNKLWFSEGFVATIRINGLVFAVLYPTSSNLRETRPGETYVRAMTTHAEASHLQGQFSNLPPIAFPPTYAEIQKKCGDVLKQCRALNTEVFILAETVMALNWDVRKQNIPGGIDTSDLGVLHTRRYDPRIYASRYFRPPRDAAIPPVQAHDPPSSHSPGVRQRRETSYSLSPVNWNASSIDIPVSGPTPRSASRYVPTSEEPRSSRTPPVTKHTRFASQSSGHANTSYPQDVQRRSPRASIPALHTPTDPSFARVPQTGSQAEQRVHQATSAATSQANSATTSLPPRFSRTTASRSRQRPTSNTPSPIPRSSSPPIVASLSSPVAYNNRDHSAPPVSSAACASNFASSSHLPVHTPDTERRGKLRDLLNNGTVDSNPCLWRFESHGLHNPHNMCFRNAALQGLIHISAFARLFLQLGDVLERDEFIHVAPLVHATIDFVRMFYHKACNHWGHQHTLWVKRDITVGQPLEPSIELSDALAAAMPHLFRPAPITGENIVVQSEEDSGEFLAAFLSKLNFEFGLIGRALRSPAWRPSPHQLRNEYMQNAKQTSIHRIFGAGFVMMIPLDETVHNVIDGLRLYFRQVAEPAYFEQLPSTLVLNLGRFVFGVESQTTVKDFRKIDIPHVLDIPEDLIASDLEHPLAVRYRLCAVVYHHGPTAVTGHYTADAAHPGYTLPHCPEEDTRPWFRMNDMAVSPVQAADVYRFAGGEKTPFVLFYERIRV